MFEPPYPPYDPTDTTCFSYETVVKRWPIIVTSIIDHLYQINHGLSLQTPQSTAFDIQSLDEDKIKIVLAESRMIMEKVSRTRYEMGRDYAMPKIEDDGEPLVEMYNQELERLTSDGKGTWFTCPWLFAECYLYRLIRSYFKLTTLWTDYDPFATQKDDTFLRSGAAVSQIATTMHELESTKDVLQSDPAKVEVLFKEMIQMCLWGNATDLSLLTHMTADDIQNLQTVGKESQEARKEFILKDDQHAVWDHIRMLKDARIDIVLDNAGFELFTDLVFADFLVTYTPHVSKVVFHPKAIPWFVSDVTPIDFHKTITRLMRTKTFASPEAAPHLDALADRWNRYVEDGTFALSVPMGTPLGAPDEDTLQFWTSPWPYWDMKTREEKLWKTLTESGLVIFKGDLNYRKLTGDIRWPASTDFALALGPLAGSFPILSLRTNKADVVVGVEQDVADKLDQSGEKWRVNGKYALISFLPTN